MATSLTSPKLAFASNEAIIAARPELAKVSLFARNFSAEAAQPGETLKVPIFLAGPAKKFNTDVPASDPLYSDYEDSNGSVIWVPMTFKEHVHSTFEFSDKDFLESSLNLWEGAGRAAGESIALSLLEALIGPINATNVPTSGLDPNYEEDPDNPGYTKGKCPIPTFSAHNEKVFRQTAGNSLKKQVAMLRGTCKKVGIKPRKSVLAINSDTFGELLDLLDSNIYGGTEAIQNGIIPNLFGFKAIMECDEWADDNMVGAVLQEDVIAVGGRVVPVEAPGQYIEVGTTTDDNSGLVLGVRRHGSPKTGKNYGTIEALFGSKLLQPTKVIRLVSEASPSPTGETGPTA